MPLASIAPRTAAAQVVAAGPGRVSAGVGARLVVPVRLLLAEGGERRVIASSSREVEIEVPLRAAANLEWNVTVRLPIGVARPGPVMVQREDGSWVELLEGTDVPVTTRRPATNPVSVAVRVRVPATSPEIVSRLVFGIVRADD